MGRIAHVFPKSCPHSVGVLLSQNCCLQKKLVNSKAAKGNAGARFLLVFRDAGDKDSVHLQIAISAHLNLEFQSIEFDNF